MPSKHTPEDHRLIDSLPMGVMTAFRSSIYQPAYITSNPEQFINNDWIDTAQLRKFLQCATHPQPDSSSPAPEPSPIRVKLENDALDAAFTRPLSPATAPGVRTRILKEGNHEVLEILSDSDMDSDQEDDLGQGSADPRESSPLPPSDSE
ncbi:hypothetical protein MVEN_00678900 [Mycena venus]|uniref:Uncharacterized protein n=1 Tax=Mycena venus TaxID=2733690 RepID=A0A8H6YQE1_9AGAR|nr:hypothetical protein MVEN_00678900 [Mycena venus]